MSAVYGTNGPPGGGQQVGMSDMLLNMFFGGWEMHDYVITGSNISVLLLIIISGIGFWWSRGLCISFLYGFIIAMAMILIPFWTLKYTEGDAKKYLFYTQSVIKLLAVIYIIYKAIAGC